MDSREDRQMDRIPVPEKLDDAIRESIWELKREQRKKRMTLAAGLSAAVVICMSGYAVGRYGAYSENVQFQSASGEQQPGEAEQFLAKSGTDTGTEEEYTGEPYLQEEEGITVTVSNVYHNGYTMYMTVLVRNSEPFWPEVDTEEEFGEVTAQIDSEGRSELEGGSSNLTSPELLEGQLIDSRTFTGTVCMTLPLQENREVTGPFAYDWRLASIHMETAGGETLECRGPWDFSLAVRQDVERTEVEEINTIAREGVGIGRVIKSPKDIRAEVIASENVSLDDYIVAMCDASGALMNSAGEYYKTENRDISTVYIFLCERERFEELRDWYRSGEAKTGAEAETFAQILKKYAVCSTELHFQSRYLCVYQMV
ncbi:DUF4179 domain-containing protein [Mediterraneibacter glycyrrhizinilyticus]|nr:DUF4179 domain-containing protein [Mediterraneibacter glycyrrhizinilyticus]MBM6854827.1 DUF4179 domain-containing protein [Mediterraneibacter glycyrrhizinilyticus]